MPADPVVAGAAPASGFGARPWWPPVRRILGTAFFALVAWLLATQARSVDWPGVAASMRAYSVGTLALAAALAACGHLVYCTYDLIGRHHTGHGVRANRVAGVGFISYAFNLNLGSLVGGVAVRYRLYSRLGLDTATITQVLTLSLLTNWLGYLWLAGTAFSLRPLELPPEWKFGSGGLRMLGAALLALASAYVVLCFGARRRQWTVLGHAVTLPSGRVALLQLAFSSTSWMLMAAVVWVLLRQHIDYPSVLGVLLIGAVAGVVAHVPAGLGVLEAVYVTLLAHRLPAAEVLAALIAYRALYYLLPLVAATLLFLVVDARGRWRSKPGAA